MTNFSLIKQLQQKPIVDTQKLPNGIKYQEYQVEPKDGTMIIFIPLKEAAAFEDAITNIDILFRSDVRKLLRVHRGIIG